MKEPKATCPIIDTAIDNCRTNINDICNDFEMIRKANGELRDWGTYWKEKAEHLEKEVDRLEARIKELEKEEVIPRS